MTVPEAKQTPFGVFEYGAVRGWRGDRVYWLSGPPSETETGWDRWIYIWWRALPPPLSAYGINLGHEPATDQWYIAVGPFFSGSEHPGVDGGAPGGSMEETTSELQAMVLLESGLRRLCRYFTGPLDEMLEQAEAVPPRNDGDPWWDRLSVS